MKTILSLILCFIISSAIGQQVTYQVLEDQPEKAYSKFIAPEFGMDYNATALCIYVGANARYGLSALDLEGAFRYDVYNGIDGLGGTFLVEGGGFLPLKSFNKQKDVPVILSYNPYADTKYENGKKYNIEETKYIKVPDGQYLNQIGVRGGVHYRRLGAQDMSYTTTSDINLAGVYLGGQFTSQAYVKTRVNNDVERIGAGFSRFYGDVLLLPVSDIANPAANEGLTADGVFGWRVGFQWYVSPHDGDYRFLGPSVFTTEIGKKPLTGFNFNLSWGFAFMSKR
ncbi:hypothetical protein [Marinoscillum furvescens]|uniref:Outer membrane protein with beta-barrel domain n=1 Tax=Marinoscillum furvescens DSM 4134 TaxID=1122208 RepID=A0A3D9L8C3_MARFU|nr:hypothetical protein [Marinoscillum furvescens]REE01753.1 hypothetical protein C7460_103270 [Marinoscillum furvescens DSM 4134]